MSSTFRVLKECKKKKRTNTGDSFSNTSWEGVTTINVLGPINYVIEAGMIGRNEKESSDKLKPDY